MPTQACLLCGSTAGLKELAANKFENKKGIYIFFSKIPPIEKKMNACKIPKKQDKRISECQVKKEWNAMYFLTELKSMCC